MSTPANGTLEPLGVVIDDEPGNSGELGSDENRDSKPSVGTSEPKGRTETMAGFDVYSPFDARSTAGTTPKRRGRPPGSRNRDTAGSDTGSETGNTKAKTPGDLTDVTKILLSMHEMMAKFLDAEYLALEKDEAKKLADAVKEVSKHYNFSLTPKQAAIADLVMVSGAIYGPRVVIAFKTAKREPAKLVQMPAPQRTAPVVVPQPAVKAEGVSLSGFTPSQLDDSIPGTLTNFE